MRTGRDGHLGQARRFMAAAHREFAAARPSLDDTGIRQAAEKAWGAVVQAANALLSKRGLKPGIGTTRKQDAMVLMADRDSRVRAAHISERYTNALHLLHARCFYDGDYNVAVVEREIRRADRLIDDIAHL